MNDKTNDLQEKIETAIDSDELRDEELDQVSGGVTLRIRRDSKGLFTMDGSTDELFSTHGMGNEFITYGTETTT